MGKIFSKEANGNAKLITMLTLLGAETNPNAMVANKAAVTSNLYVTGEPQITVIVQKGNAESYPNKASTGILLKVVKTQKLRDRAAEIMEGNVPDSEVLDLVKEEMFARYNAGGEFTADVLRGSEKWPFPLEEVLPKTISTLSKECGAFPSTITETDIKNFMEEVSNKFGKKKQSIVEQEAKA